MKKPINEIAKMRRIAGLITESEYQEALQEEKGLVKVGEKVLSQDKKPYWADENLNTIDTKTLTTYTKGDYNIEVVESQFYFEGDEENKISFSVSVKVFKDENLIKKKLFYPGAERWKGMSIEDFIDYTTQLINGDVNEYQETLQEENSTPSEQLRQIVLKYIKPEYHDKVENTYDRYINFLKAYTKPVTGKDRKGIYPAIIKNLVKVKSIDPSEILNHYKVENLDLLGDLMFKTPDVALSILKKLDKDKITESEYQETLTTENQSSSLDVTNKKAVLQFLANNGIDDDYLEDMGGIESGSDEWLEVLSVLTGKDAYADEFDVEDDKKISDFLITLDRLGIDFV